VFLFVFGKFNFPKAPATRKPVPAPVPADTPATEPVADTSATVDEELEKRKKRAARFGVPLVETPKSHPSPAKRGSNTPRTAATRTAVSDVRSYQLLPYANRLMFALQEPDKLRARAARFGIIKHAAPVIGKKRSVEEAVDTEELERRKKRAERFGIPSVVCSSFRSVTVMLIFNHREIRLENMYYSVLIPLVVSPVRWRNLYGHLFPSDI
jgi:hypothetical protein